MTRETFTPRTLEMRLQNLPAHMVYAQLTGREDWGAQMAEKIPGEHMRAALVRWIGYGGHVGGFLGALLSNDLMRAFAKADEMNLAAMPGYVRFLFNYAPAGSYGSKEAVERWAKEGGLIARFAEDAA